MATSSPVVSVAGSSSAAAAGGSVINVSNLVTQLVAATRAPRDAQIANKTTAVTAQISALGTLKGSLSTFQNSLASLSSPDAFNAETASSSDNTVFTAAAGNGAVSGSYAVTVDSLASSQQLVSGPLATSPSGSVGTGTLTLQLGAKSFALQLASPSSTVAGLAAAINSAANNPGITASVVQGTDGAHLLLSSTLTGAANRIQVTESDGGTALAALTYGVGNTGHYTENAQATDASFSVAGVPYTSASNTVSDALSGVTLTLTGKTAAGNHATLGVASDTSAASQNIQDFVTAYNTLHAAITPLGSYDAASGTAGPMLGNPILTGIQAQMQNALQSIVGTSGYNSLPSIGITTNADGTMALDANKLQSALGSNVGAVRDLFSSSKGVAAQLNAQIKASLASGGLIDNASKTLVKQNTALTDQTNSLDTEMATMTANLTQQYSALNVLLSQLQTTSAYLSQQISTLPTVQGKSNG